MYSGLQRICVLHRVHCSCNTHSREADTQCIQLSGRDDQARRVCVTAQVIIGYAMNYSLPLAAVTKF